MRIINFVFWMMAIIGISRVAWKYAEAAWAIDPLASVAVGGSMAYSCMLFFGKAMGWEK